MNYGQRWKMWLDVVAGTSMVVTSVVLICVAVSAYSLLSGVERPKGRNSSAPAWEGRSFSLDAVPFKGQPEPGGVGVIEFSDFQCPFCRRFAADTLPRVIKEYVEPGRVFFGYQHLPLEGIHPLALRAAEAAECGRRQGQFWQVHDALFARNLDESSLGAIGLDLSGLDFSRFHPCMNGAAVEVVRKSAAEARSLGIRGTPTFLFGVVTADGSLRILRQESGALTFEKFSEVVEWTADEGWRLAPLTR